MAAKNPDKQYDIKTEVNIIEDRIYEGKGTPRFKLPFLTQLGFAVKDVDKAVEHFSSVFGIGPWRILVVEGNPNIIRGKKMNCKFKIGFAQHGSVEIEFIEVLEGDTPHAQFLRERGEGIQHIAFGYVKDLHGKMAELAKDGYEPVLYANSEVFKEVYLESTKPGASGVHIQLREMNDEADPKLLAQLAAPQSK